MKKTWIIISFLISSTILELYKEQGSLMINPFNALEENHSLIHYLNSHFDFGLVITIYRLNGLMAELY